MIKPRINNNKLETISDNHAIISIGVDTVYADCMIQYKTYDINKDTINDWTDLKILDSVNERFEFARFVQLSEANLAHIYFIDFRLKLLCGDA